MQLVSKLKEESRVLDFSSKNQLSEKAIQEYQLPFGADYLRYKLGWSLNFADGAIAEYKRFVTMALRSDKEITPSVAVDEVWHYHILHTKDYAKFAEKIGYFLDHNPGAANEMPRFSRQYEQTLQFYKEIFKQEPPVDFWPRQSQVAESNVDLKTESFSRKLDQDPLILEARKHLKCNRSWKLFEQFLYFASAVRNEHEQFLSANYRNINSFNDGILYLSISPYEFQDRKTVFKFIEDNLGVKMTFKQKMAILLKDYFFDLNRQSFRVESLSASPAFEPLISRINELGYEVYAQVGITHIELIAKFSKR